MKKILVLITLVFSFNCMAEAEPFYTNFRMTIYDGKETPEQWQLFIGGMFTDLQKKDVKIVKEGKKIFLVSRKDSTLRFPLGDIGNTPIMDQCREPNYGMMNGKPFTECSIGITLPLNVKITNEIVDITFKKRTLVKDPKGHWYFASKAQGTEVVTFYTDDNRTLTISEEVVMNASYNSLEEVVESWKKEAFKYEDGDKSPLYP